MSKYSKTKEELFIELKELKQKYNSLEKMYASNILNLDKKNKASLLEKEELQNDELIQLTEKSLKKESIYKRLFNNSLSIKLLLDPTTGNIIDVNESACNFYGWTYSELCQKNITQLNSLSKAEAKVEMRKAIEEKGKYFLFKHKLASGEMRDIESYTSPIQFGNKTLLCVHIKDITEQKKLEFDLGERIKELECHNQISKVMSDTTLTYEEVCEKIVNLIPPGWQFPGITEASIKIDKTTFQTANFKKSKNTLHQNIIIKGKVIGHIKVCLLDDKLPVTNQLFLPEESDLLFNIAERIGNFVEKKRNYQRIFESEEKYSKIFQTSPYAIGITRLSDGKYVEVNDTFSTISGYKSKEILDKIDAYNFWVNSEDRNKMVATLIEGKKVLDKEYQFKNKRGEILTAILSAQLITLNDETFIMSSINDITAKRQLEREAKESDTLYRAIINASPDNITITDLNGIILFTSPIAIEIFGYDSAEKMLNRNFMEFVVPEDRERAQFRVIKMKEGIFIGAQEYRLIKADNTIIHVEVNGKFIRDENGTPTRMIFVVRDVTNRIKMEKALTKSQENFKLLIDSAPVGIVISDKDQKVVSVNKKFNQITGYTKDDFFSLNGWMNIAYPDKVYREKVTNQWSIAMDNYIKGKSDFASIETQVTCKDNSFKYFEIILVAIHDVKIITFVDVTERTLNSIELLNQKNYITSLFNAIPDIVFVINNKGIILDVNLGKENDLYVPAEVFLNKKIADVLPPTIAQKFQSKINKTLAGYSTEPMQYKLQIKDELTNYEARFSRLDDDKIIAIVSNIEWRIKSENALKDSEEKYKALFYDSPDGYLIIRDGQFIECNKAAEKLIGGDREKIIGCTPGQISPKIQPNGRNSAEMADEFIKETFEKGSSSFNWVHKRFDGTEVYFWIHLTMIVYEGEKVLLTTWRDITELQKSEEKLRKISQAVEQSPVSIVISDIDGIIEYANPKACETTGYTAEELIGCNPRVLKSGETSKEEYEDLWENISTGKKWSGIFHNKKKNGELYWESSTISPIIDTNGNITHYIGIKEDITQQRKVQTDLLESEKRFSQIAEQSRSVIWEVNLDGLYTYVSPLSEMVWGYTPDELIGKKHFYDLHPTKGCEQFKNEALEVINRKQSFNDFLNQIVTKSKETIWVSTNGIPMFDNENNLIGCRGADNDVTDRIEALEELSKFRTITDQSTSGNVISDLNGNLIYLNEAFANMYGYEVEEIIGKHLSLLYKKLQLIHVNELMDLLKKEGEFTAEEAWGTRKDGSDFVALMNAKVILNSDNQPMFFSVSAIDITNIKNSEILIRKSEENLNYAQELAKMGSWEIDIETNKVSWSKNYYKLVGIDPSEKPLTRAEIKKLIHPDDQELYENKIARFIKSKAQQAHYFRLINPDGSIKWIQTNIVPNYENDQLVSIKGVSIDITDKKNAEEKIRQQNIRLNAIIDAMPDHIFISDQDGNYLEYFSEKSKEMFFPKEKLTGLNDKDIYDDATAKLFTKMIKKCLEQKDLVTFEYFSSKNENQKFYEARLIALDNNQILRIVRDITNRKEQESEIRKLNLAIVQSPALIVITDLGANIEYVNPAFEKSTGYTKEELIGQNTRILQSGKTNPSVYKCLWETIGQKNKTWFGEWMNKKKNGELFWESISITPIFDENGVKTNYLGVKQDITAQKKAERKIKDLNENLEEKIDIRTQQLKETNTTLVEEIDAHKKTEIELLRAKSEAEKANMAKSEFLSRMSHELRTPLNSILGFAQLLEMGELRPDQDKGINHIKKSGKHLLNLINEVLDIARIESGRISLSLEPVELRSVIMGVIDILQPLANSKQINIDFSNFVDNYLFVKADKQRLKQVMLNLINNAIKYNHEGGSIAVKTEVIDNFIRISISDTGIGISAEDIAKIFTPFERIGAEKTSTEGTGLGLSVVKKLMEAMGGKIGIESVLKKGTTFWVEFPASESQNKILKKSIGKLTNETYKKDLKGLILYIEDNPSNIELVEQILTNQRPEIKLITNMNGKQAVKLASELNPDLILLDLNLPDIHGSDVLKLLLANKKTKSTPIVVVSADAMPHQIDKLIKNGAKDFLTKPLEIFNFLEVVDRWVNEKEST